MPETTPNQGPMFGSLSPSEAGRKGGAITSKLRHKRNVITDVTRVLDSSPEHRKRVVRAFLKGLEAADPSLWKIYLDRAVGPVPKPIALAINDMRPERIVLETTSEPQRTIDTEKTPQDLQDPKGPHNDGEGDSEPGGTP